ncbi:hypothetical protein K443DRAFT_443028 [Laccaria amethystina LaAM-08-1]|uniref:Uncharacterized protein n=1 Tax=Laccaria amethystina LaAM-08-1 TaxID=1095629 RepID=A0A0C9Y1X7_9AGAR|nr:hypothetical protein K443DRAFT_443028 [Laccaria amethystina LaAM-08-1]
MYWQVPSLFPHSVRPCNELPNPTRRSGIPRELRLLQTEDECHGMLYCAASSVCMKKRGVFFSDVPLSPLNSLRFLVSGERIARHLAKYALLCPGAPYVLCCNQRGRGRGRYIPEWSQQEDSSQGHDSWLLIASGPSRKVSVVRSVTTTGGAGCGFSGSVG